MEKSIIENIANWYMPLDENNVEFFFWTFFHWYTSFLYHQPILLIDLRQKLYRREEEKNIFLVFALKMTNFDENV